MRSRHPLSQAPLSPRALKFETPALAIAGVRGFAQARTLHAQRRQEGPPGGREGSSQGTVPLESSSGLNGRSHSTPRCNSSHKSPSDRHLLAMLLSKKELQMLT